MKKYSIESTAKTPSISLDFGTGVLEVKGRSFPENAIEFYKPLFDALEEYARSAKSTTKVNFQLENFDTASAKCILDIFKKLEKIGSETRVVIINWYYKEGDEDTLEAGEDYAALISLKFNLIEVSE
jgi:hypothetical protein